MDWAVCKHVTSGLCSPRDGTKQYAPEIGSSQFRQHFEMHRPARFNNRSVTIQLPSDCKERSIHAAAAVVAHDNLPHNFAYHKTGFMGLVKTLIKIRQSYLAASSTDMISLLTTLAAVREEK